MIMDERQHILQTKLQISAEKVQLFQRFINNFINRDQSTDLLLIKKFILDHSQNFYQIDAILQFIATYVFNLNSLPPRLRILNLILEISTSSLKEGLNFIMDAMYPFLFHFVQSSIHNLSKNNLIPILKVLEGWTTQSCFLKAELENFIYIIESFMGNMQHLPSVNQHHIPLAQPISVNKNQDVTFKQSIQPATEFKSVHNPIGNIGISKDLQINEDYNTPNDKSKGQHLPYYQVPAGVMVDLCRKYTTSYHPIPIKLASYLPPLPNPTPEIQKALDEFYSDINKEIDKEEDPLYLGFNIPIIDNFIKRRYGELYNHDGDSS